MEKVVPQNAKAFPLSHLRASVLPPILRPLLALWETSTVSNHQLAFSVSFIILYLHFDYIFADTILRPRSGVNFWQLTIKSAEILVTKCHLKGKGSCEIKQRSEQSLVERGHDQGS